MNRLKIFLFNALLLSGTSILIRTVGVSFNIYVSNKIGAAGMGLLSLIMSVYSLSVTFATSGINLAASRLTAEAIGRNSDAEIKKAMKCCIIYSLSFGTAAFIILFLCSDFIGNTILNDPRTVISIKFFSISLPCLALSSALHGYFTAVRRVYKSASAHILEQFIKIFLTSLGFIYLAPKGLKYACLAVIASGSVAEIISFLYTFIMFKLDIKKHNKNTGSVINKIHKNLLNITIPVALSAYVRSALLTIENLLIPYGLKRSGSSYEQALASYGVVSGMVFPIIMFPQAFLSSFSGLLIPELAECKTRGDEKKINYIIGRVFQMVLCFSVGASGIIIAYSYELGNILYNNAEASLYIKLIAPLIPVMYLDNAVDGMLKGLNQQLYSMRVNIVDAFLSVVMVYFLLPLYGIKAYIVIIFICEIINASCSIGRLLSISDIKFQIVKWVFKPLFCIIGSTACVRLFFLFSGIIFKYDIIELIINIIATTLLYIIFLRITLSINSDDVRWIKSVVKR